MGRRWLIRGGRFYFVGLGGDVCMYVGLVGMGLWWVV